VSDHLHREFNNDIGKVIGKPITDLDKYELLTNHWIPPGNYAYPYSEHNKRGKIEKRYASKNHLDSFEWLVLSDSRKGFFCKYCPLFTPGLTGGFKNNVSLQKLVSQPLTSFSKLLGKDGYLNVHSNNHYHKAAVQFGQNFLRTYKNPEKEITNQVFSHRLQLIEENRKKLVPIVESVIFLGRQNVPLRGHRDDGQFSFKETKDNEGNFRELLKFRVKSGDTDLKNHLQNSSCRATYISKTTQNCLINACGEEILSVILKRVKESGVYSIMFDETTDISHQSQLTLILRYVYEGNIREDFIEFINPRDDHNVTEDEDRISESGSTPQPNDITEPTVTGVDLAKHVLAMMSSHGLNVENCVGISTDGCSVMTSDVKGAVKEIQKKAKHAVYSPCHNHALNLAISKASSVQAIRNTVGTMTEIISFFKASSKRYKILRQVLGHSLTSLCETRWIERHESVIEFKTSFSKICDALEHISNWKDASSSSKAKTLLNALCDSEFVVSVNSLSDVFSVTMPLSRLYQKEAIDIKRAKDILLSTLRVLETKRTECEEGFHNIYEEAKKDAANLGVELKTPRISKLQKNRPNFKCDSPEDYYRVSVYIPLVEHILEDLKARFSEETLGLHNLAVFVPAATEKRTPQEEENCCLEVVCKRYYSLAGFHSSSLMLFQLKGEIQSWMATWKIRHEQKQTIPKNALDAFLSCDKEVYPIIHLMLKVLASLPVSIASAERSFSSLRRLKTWLRSTMTEERLVGLALLNIHRDIPVDVSNVITRFSKSGNHRLDFIV
jgi:hypothetical protein